MRSKIVWHRQKAEIQCSREREIYIYRCGISLHSFEYVWHTFDLDWNIAIWIKTYKHIINIKIWTCLGIFRILIFILYISLSLTYVRTGCERCSLGSLRCLSEFVGPGRCAPCDEGPWTPLDVRTSDGHQNGYKITKSDRFFDYVFQLRKDYIWAASHSHISHSHITRLEKTSRSMQIDCRRECPDSNCDMEGPNMKRIDKERLHFWHGKI